MRPCTGVSSSAVAHGSASQPAIDRATSTARRLRIVPKPPARAVRRSRRLWSEPVALGPERRLRAVGHAELAEDPRQVRLDGLLADLQAAGDQLVRQAL